MKSVLDDSVPHCLECGDILPYGRKDRKFCSAACKNRYHNREARHWRFRYARTIGILQKNHEILRHLIQLGIRAIPKAELNQLGYQPDFVTSFCRVGRRTVCRCFDIVFCDTENRLTQLGMETTPRLPEVGEE
jgi:predicted nucleic acid-binding Zn ribbon protein